MKVLIVALVVLAGLCFVEAEIVPRFPGVQPIVVLSDSAAGSGVDTGDVEDKLIIDTFEVDTQPPVIIQLPSTGAPPTITKSSFDGPSDTILGRERDVILTAERGSNSLVFSAGASGGEFTIATPNQGSGFCLVQYDGVDGSTNLGTGLGGVDVTQNEALGFRLLAKTDIATQFSITLVDTAGRTSTAFAEISGGVVVTSFFFDFELFIGDIDLTTIGAIEFEVQAFDNVDFALASFSTYGFASGPTNCFSGRVLPCDIDYYRIEKFDNVQVGDYFVITYTANIQETYPDTTGNFYVLASEFEDLQTELATNTHVIDTLGALPGEKYYDYHCGSDCDIEIVWSALQNTTYYFGVEGKGTGILDYTICLAYRNVPVFQLLDRQLQPIFFDQRPDIPPDDRVRHYRYYVIDIPEQRFSPGTYLQVNISRAEPIPGLTIRLMYESLPETANDTGILDQPDFNSRGNRVDDMIYPYCIDMDRTDKVYYEHPVTSDPRIPCECTTEVLLFGAGPSFQLTCNVTVDPCHFKYGNWYISVELPARNFPDSPFDESGQTNYTIAAYVVQPIINELSRNETYHYYVNPESMAHFFIDVPALLTVPGESHLLVHVSNIRGGAVNIYVHQGLGEPRNLAGGREACVPANVTCTTDDACNLVVEKCHFVPGTWYISVEVVYDFDLEEFICDWDRLPVGYSIRANWLEDPIPTPLIAGVAVSKYIGESLYDFYVLNVPPTVDTWLIVEIYAQACDTEVILSVLHGELPGGECYSRPDFYCLTGDPKEKLWSTGPPTFYQDEPVQRESCSFMIQTCELEPGPLFFSVYGHHKGYVAYGDTTYYQVPVHYTLWVDFDTALPLTSAVSYTETVFEGQYQHYYIRADKILQGSWLSVEVTNIQHAIPQSIEAFVNYNYLAGNCPCYENLFNCTGADACSLPEPALPIPTFIPDTYDTVVTCCTIVVPASDFRPGVWYVSVFGVNEDFYQYTTPIGYTLTVTIHNPPDFIPLILGQTYSGIAPQWNRTYEYSLFRLGASPIPLNDLVFKLTFVQNCEFMGKHDDTRDSLWLYVNSAAPASALGYDYSCKADVFGESFCTIVVPHCEWIGDNYFVSVQGDYEAIFEGRFTLQAFTREVREIQLTDGVSHYDRVGTDLYKHFFISTVADGSQYLYIDIYTNSDQDYISAYLNKDEKAGASPCFRNTHSCTTKSSCVWQIKSCEMSPGRYYISVKGEGHQFYDTSVEFTIAATHKNVHVSLFSGNPVTGTLWNPGDVAHYKYSVADLRIGSVLRFVVDNVKHGVIQAYSQYDAYAGRCPCDVYEHTCSAGSGASGEGTDTLSEWCEIIIPICELTNGDYYFSVWAVENLTPDPPVFQTPIGYVVEVDLTSSLILTPFVDVGRDLSKTEIFQFVGDKRYVHYQFDYTADDYALGYHVIVEITEVRDGTLFVYFNKGYPADSYSDCHIAQICNINTLSSGRQCFWQLPYCLTKPDPDVEDQKYYISVEGVTGRSEASYNILIYKQDVPTVLADNAFSLDVVQNSAAFPLGTELNITHSKQNQPNGWTQFIRLIDVPHADLVGRGELLEIFFYRVTNNPGQPLDFDVFVHPNIPAGAHQCCPESQLGFCQGAPCSNTADTTTAINNGVDVITHTCNFAGVGVGNDGNGNPFFGEKCTVRVWPCEFEKYCNATTDWFVSVVPSDATLLTSNGVGLAYSVQWRVRNIKEPSFDLTPSLNTYGFTDTFTLSSNNTESDGWASYFVDWPGAIANSTVGARLSIQTNWVSGSGVVYINGDEFASDEDCYSYKCDTTALTPDCSGDGRFIVAECCENRHQRYYISVRNTGGPNVNVEYQFRITSVVFPNTISIVGNLTEDDVYVSVSQESVFPLVTGIEGENYDFYSLTIDDNDLSEHQTLVIIVDRPDDVNDSGVIDVYIRYGVEAGLYGTADAQDYYGSAVEGCNTWAHSCSTLPGERCIFEFPACALIKGHYFISLRNPSFLSDNIPTDLPDYTLYTFWTNPPYELTLGVPYNATVLTSLGFYQHYAVTILPEDILFDQTGSAGYWTKYLRVSVVNYDTSVELLVNYDEIANNFFACTDPILSNICIGDGACYLDIVPCGDNYLRTGTYYFAVNAATDFYDIQVDILSNDYRTLDYQTIEGTGHRSGTSNLWWTWTVTEEELLANGDGFGHYRYYIEAGEELADNEYFIFNITAHTQPDDNGLHFEVWRDDCTRWHCDTFGSHTWCTIDALELATCTSKNGRFFIRVDNPAAYDFSLDVYRNHTTVQTLLDTQRITEIVYPYEYQEYYYEAKDVGEAAVLSVVVCSLCGEVQAWIRPDLPAGPAGANQESDCAIDSCNAIYNPDSSIPADSCCVLFLDTCVYEQRGYYIAIRGVAIEYPQEPNPFLYLPAKYNIVAEQTNIKINDISFSACPQVVVYEDDVSSTPVQYAIDVETIQLATTFRVSLRVPLDFYESDSATVWFTNNRTVGYTDLCQEPSKICSTFGEASCSFIVYYCDLQELVGGRFYLWVDAPRGSELIVERWEPVIPQIHTDLQYFGTVNVDAYTASNAVDFDLPYTPGVQFYRFELDPKGDENYYEHFFVRIAFTNIKQGSLLFGVSGGYVPRYPNSDCEFPDYYELELCYPDETCYVDILYDDLIATFGDEKSIPSVFFLSVFGDSATCELHTIQYEFTIKTKWVITYFPLTESVCDTVGQREYNFHRLRPHAVEEPQGSILRFNFEDINPGDYLNVIIRDSYMPTSTSQVVVSNSGESNLEAYYICGYKDLYFSVYGDFAGSDSSDSDSIGYRLTVDKVRVHVKFVYDDSIYYADDDDDDACPHTHDFYLFKTAQPLGHHAGSFFRVAVDSEYPTKVFINKDTFAWNGCHDSGYGENDPAETGTTTVNVYDFCDFHDGRYYITVVSDGPYYIYTDIRDDAIPLSLGSIYRDTLQVAEYQVYSLEICEDWFDYDDRLVVEISDVENGGVYGWIRYGGVPGIRSTDFGFESCAEDVAFADYAPESWGYDFLLVNHGNLQAGTYYILIRTAPHEGSPSRNCERVSYRLFPYLVDYDIPEEAITELHPNVPLTSAVDYYWINRYDPTVSSTTNYYVLHPLMEGEGYFEQVSQAVIQLYNVQGGLLTLRVSRDSLAVPETGYIPGPIKALTEDHLLDNTYKFQSGRLPYTRQYIFDSPEEGCTGNADYCCSTTYEDSEPYAHEKSCAVWLPSCYYIWSVFYIAVDADLQFYQNQEITYGLQAVNTRDYILIQPNTHKLGAFLDDNWGYDFYYSISPHAQSMRWRVVVTEGEGVLVTVRNHRCPKQADWVKEIWCDADYYNRPWLCDIEIATAAAHPGDNAYFISVNGKNATYSIAFYRGRENCHEFTGAGRNEGLDFCAGLVPYATWRWDNYINLDNQAHCLFEQLYDHFRVQPCWSGVSRACNATLQEFACYESFHACDEFGFAVGTCRDACDAVVYECVNWFESVDLEHYNCTSSRYLDQSIQTCTGDSDFDTFNEWTQEFLENDPNLILYKSRTSTSSASGLLYSVFVTIVAIVLLL